jgi:hypothetical protein
VHGVEDGAVYLNYYPDGDEADWIQISWVLGCNGCDTSDIRLDNVIDLFLSELLYNCFKLCLWVICYTLLLGSHNILIWKYLWIYQYGLSFAIASSSKPHHVTVINRDRDDLMFFTMFTRYKMSIF